MAGHPDLSGVGSLEPSDHAKQRALARPAPPEQDVDPPLGERAGQPGEYDARTERQVDVADIDETGIQGGLGRALGWLSEAFQGRPSGRSTSRRSRSDQCNPMVEKWEQSTE